MLAVSALSAAAMCVLLFLLHKQVLENRLEVWHAVIPIQPHWILLYVALSLCMRSPFLIPLIPSEDFCTLHGGSFVRLFYMHLWSSVE